MNNKNSATVVELQNRISHLESQLAQAQRMMSLGELVGTTTHEFNNILMTIINYAKLGMRYDDAEMQEKAFNKILTAGNRAAKITNSILSMARNGGETFQNTDIAKLIDNSMELLEREMQKYRISVEKEINSVPQVRAVGNQIQQVLLNLLINARQAMEEGGRLIVKLSHDKQANTVDLVVRDFGSGIPTDRLPKIFDAYFSTKSGPDATGKGGTGLGLATCRNIIEAHGGKIRVESSVGVGTCFTINLPAVTKKPLPAPHANFSTTALRSTTTADA